MFGFGRFGFVFCGFVWDLAWVLVDLFGEFVLLVGLCVFGWFVGGLLVLVLFCLLCLFV